MGQSVVVKNLCTRATWVPGIIVHQLGPLTYMIEVSTGKFWKQHVHHVKEFYTSKRLFSVSERTETDNNDDESFLPFL